MILTVNATNSHKIKLTKTQETLLITLHAKALDSRSRHSILQDHAAAALAQTIDFDFGKFKSFDNDNLIVVRARQYDAWIHEFLDAHPQAVVVNLGCGLDTRVTRIHPPASVSWFDVDYPEVMDLRKNFYANASTYTMLASSITEPQWLDAIPANMPTCVIAEGVLEYLTEAEVRALFNRLTSHFAQGQLMFDVMNAYAIQSAQAEHRDANGPIHKWAVDDWQAVDQLDTKLERVTVLPLFDSVYMRQLPWLFRLLYGLVARSAKYKTVMQLGRYAF